MVWYLAGAYESKGLTVLPLTLSDELLAWGVRRADPSLQQSVNGFLKKAQARGEVDQIVRRWIPKFQ
jgi:ABC-type amino acid transport substrate-binding protein